MRICRPGYHSRVYSAAAYPVRVDERYVEISLRRAQENVFVKTFLQNLSGIMDGMRTLLGPLRQNAFTRRMERSCDLMEEALCPIIRIRSGTASDQWFISLGRHPSCKNGAAIATYIAIGSDYASLRTFR